MEKNRSTYLLISLTFLTLVSFSLFFFTREESSPKVSKDLFGLADTEKIDVVVLSSARGKVELRFQNNRWRVNDRWEADMQMIKLLFATLKQAKVRRPVAASEKDSVLQLIKLTGTQVTLSETGGVTNSFIASGNESKTEAWFLKEGDTQPYVMIIPGYRVYVSGILELDESGWRNKRIFDFPWRNFRSLKATYAREPGQSLEIEMTGQYFGIKNMERVDTAKLNSYLDAVSLLFATRFVSSGQKAIDSLIKTIPSVRIEIKDIASRAYTLELFPPRKKDGQIFGRTGDGELVAFDRNILAEIMRRKDYFVFVNPQ